MVSGRLKSNQTVDKGVCLFFTFSKLSTEGPKHYANLPQHWRYKGVDTKLNETKFNLTNTSTNAFCQVLSAKITGNK